MEPAVVVCTSVAVGGLGWWFIGRAAWLIRSVPDRLARAFDGGGPSRAVATAVVAVVGFLTAPRVQASAEPIPPLVRLADEQSMEPNGAQAQQPSPTDPTIYEVVRGDSLWSIAAAELRRRTGSDPSSGEIARFWPTIYAANRDVIGDDPNLILPGQHLEIPER